MATGSKTFGPSSGQGRTCRQRPCIWKARGARPTEWASAKGKTVSAYIVAAYSLSSGQIRDFKVLRKLGSPI